MPQSFQGLRNISDFRSRSCSATILPWNPPPHQQTRALTDRAAEDLGGWFPDEKSAASYHTDKNVGYHQDRFRAIKYLAKRIDTSGQAGLHVVDFGVGDGRELVDLGLPLGKITGIDISPHMVKLARSNFHGVDSDFHVGGVESLSRIDPDSSDLLVSTNVLGYLPEEEETLFFSEARRIVRPGGWLLLTLGNELFDLFALNSGSADFFRDYFDVDGASLLLTRGDEPRFGNARRHNPLSLESRLFDASFETVAFSFSQWHRKPPILEQLEKGASVDDARMSVRDHDFDPNSLPPAEKWRAFFQCSLFGVLSQRQ